MYTYGGELAEDEQSQEGQLNPGQTPEKATAGFDLEALKAAQRQHEADKTAERDRQQAEAAAEQAKNERRSEFNRMTAKRGEIGSVLRAKGYDAKTVEGIRQTIRETVGLHQEKDGLRELAQTRANDHREKIAQIKEIVGSKEEAADIVRQNWESLEQQLQTAESDVRTIEEQLQELRQRAEAHRGRLQEFDDVAPLLDELAQIDKQLAEYTEKDPEILLSVEEEAVAENEKRNQFVNEVIGNIAVDSRQYGSERPPLQDAVYRELIHYFIEEELRATGSDSIDDLDLQGYQQGYTKSHREMQQFMQEYQYRDPASQQRSRYMSNEHARITMDRWWPAMQKGAFLRNVLAPDLSFDLALNSLAISDVENRRENQNIHVLQEGSNDYAAARMAIINHLGFINKLKATIDASRLSAGGFSTTIHPYGAEDRIERSVAYQGYLQKMGIVESNGVLVPKSFLDPTLPPVLRSQMDPMTEGWKAVYAETKERTAKKVETAARELAEKSAAELARKKIELQSAIDELQTDLRELQRLTHGEQRPSLDTLVDKRKKAMDNTHAYNNTGNIHFQQNRLAGHESQLRTLESERPGIFARNRHEQEKASVRTQIVRAKQDIELVNKYITDAEGLIIRLRKRFTNRTNDRVSPYEIESKINEYGRALAELERQSSGRL